LQTAETGGLQRRVVVMLAQRLKPAERLDFDQAITELEHAVEIALDVIARGERGGNEDAFVSTVLAEVAEKTRNNDLDGAHKPLPTHWPKSTDAKQHSARRFNANELRSSMPPSSSTFCAATRSLSLSRSNIS
jgi:hypothetical protein